MNNQNIAKSGSNVLRIVHKYISNRTAHLILKNVTLRIAASMILFVRHELSWHSIKYKRWNAIIIIA